MKLSTLRRRAQIFVCTNRRDAGDPLGAGCGDRGEAVHEALRTAIGSRRAWTDVWLARTGCLGVCPKHGCTVALAPSGGVVEEVEPDDVDTLLDVALGSPTAAR
jgi:(2Fe-2S) ferredoxin